MDGAHYAGNDPLGGAIEPVSILKALLTGFLDLKTRKVVKMYIEWNFFWSKYLINGLSAHVLVKVHFAHFDSRIKMVFKGVLAFCKVPLKVPPGLTHHVEGELDVSNDIQSKKE